MSAKDTPAVPNGNGPKSRSLKGDSRGAVQKKPVQNAQEYADLLASADKDLDSIDTVAVELGIPPARLKGYIGMNRICDPIGSVVLGLVYRSTLGPLKKRLAVQPTVAPIGASIQPPQGLETADRADGVAP